MNWLKFVWIILMVVGLLQSMLGPDSEMRIKGLIMMWGAMIMGWMSEDKERKE